MLRTALVCLLQAGSDALQRCPSFDGERSETLLEFIGDDPRKDEVREILHAHVARSAGQGQARI